MNARSILMMAGAFVTVATISCASTVKRLPVPERSTVNRVVVSGYDVAVQNPERAGETSSTRERPERVIDDPQVIGRLVFFLIAHNTGWYVPWHTFPGPQYTVTLKRNQEQLLVVWVGTNWIGGREGTGENAGSRLRSVSEQERAEILGILGIPKD